jgi:hypothetical protein
MNNNRPRYAFVPRGDQGASDALYDIVDNGRGAEEVMAYCVRYKPAVDIVDALNEREKLRNFFTT